MLSIVLFDWLAKNTINTMTSAISSESNKMTGVIGSKKDMTINELKQLYAEGKIGWNITWDAEFIEHDGYCSDLEDGTIIYKTFTEIAWPGDSRPHLLDFLNDDLTSVNSNHYDEFGDIADSLSFAHAHGMCYKGWCSGRFGRQAMPNIKSITIVHSDTPHLNNIDLI